jgi:hypothetical protein
LKPGVQLLPRERRYPEACRHPLIAVESIDQGLVSSRERNVI